ncbi:MAG: hypothetical protein WEB03_09655 [Nitriliruptor sp.]
MPRALTPERINDRRVWATSVEYGPTLVDEITETLSALSVE